MAPLNSDYYASNDETKSDSFGCRESFSSRYYLFFSFLNNRHLEVCFSLESTPSDFDDEVSERFKMMTEHELFDKYLAYLNEMDLDLVFVG